MDKESNGASLTKQKMSRLDTFNEICFLFYKYLCVLFIIACCIVMFLLIAGLRYPSVEAFTHSVLGPITIMYVWYFLAAYLFISLVMLVYDVVNWWYRRNNSM